jgi:hypothetical protein
MKLRLKLCKITQTVLYKSKSLDHFLITEIVYCVEQLQ